MSILKSTNSGKYVEPITISYLINDLHLVGLNYSKNEIIGEFGQWSISFELGKAGNCIQLYNGVWTWSYLLQGEKLLKLIACKYEVDQIYSMWCEKNRYERALKMLELVKTLKDYNEHPKVNK